MHCLPAIHALELVDGDDDCWWLLKFVVRRVAGACGGWLLSGPFHQPTIMAGKAMKRKKEKHQFYHGYKFFLSREEDTKTKQTF
jgi:hypothetical protein